MTTIAVDDDVKKELLKLSAQLQLKLGRRIDFNDVLRYLLKSQLKRPELLDKAVINGLDSKILRDELNKERKRDENKLDRHLRD